MKKLPLTLIGFLQALGVVIYCGLISLLFNGNFQPASPAILTSVVVLLIFVFSAAITGLLVFGYPTYLALQKKFKAALTILGYTLFYFLVIILLGLIILANLS